MQRAFPFSNLRGVVGLVNIEYPNFYLLMLILVNWLGGVNSGSVGIIGDFTRWYTIYSSSRGDFVFSMSLSRREYSTVAHFGIDC